MSSSPPVVSDSPHAPLEAHAERAAPATYADMLNLERRVSLLEDAAASNPSGKLARQQATSAERAIQEWDRLSKGQTKTRVLELLGSPRRKSASEVAEVWHYPDYASVAFKTAKGQKPVVSGWMEPLAYQVREVAAP